MVEKRKQGRRKRADGRTEKECGQTEAAEERELNAPDIPHSQAI